MLSSIEKILKSLHRINNFPFFSAEYFGNYHLNSLMDGLLNEPVSITRFFQTLFKDQGAPAQIGHFQPPEWENACSAFYVHDNEGKSVVGKNLDWKQDPVLVLKTKPESGYHSLSLVNLSFCDFFGLKSLPHQLILAPFVPLDGINEKGLVISMLSLSDLAKYPVDVKKVSVGDFNIIRIVLDTCSYVEEAIAVFNRFNLIQTGPLPLHFLIADKKECCIIELFDNQMHVLRSSDSLFLTNFLIQNTSSDPASKKLCNRYSLLDKQIKESEGIFSAPESEQLLDKVSVFQPGFGIPSTIWSVLYSPQESSIKVRVGDESEFHTFGF